MSVRPDVIGREFSTHPLTGEQVASLRDLET
jgi:hypothetical protein